MNNKKNYSTLLTILKAMACEDANCIALCNLHAFNLKSWGVCPERLTSQESPVYSVGQEHTSTVFAGPPVPDSVASSRPTSPKLSRWVWVKYRALILKPTRPAKTIMSSCLETGLLVPAWRQFPCKQWEYRVKSKQHCGVECVQEKHWKYPTVYWSLQDILNHFCLIFVPLPV